MKILILCLLIGSIAAINQSEKNFQEVATSRISSGCLDRIPAMHRDCKKLNLSCRALRSKCKKTLKQAVGNSEKGKACQKRLTKKDANTRVYQFCPGSCTMCRDGQWSAWESSPCTKSCGSDGIQTKTRSCDSPSPIGGGNPCVGSPSEEIVCALMPCPKPAVITTTETPITTTQLYTSDTACCSEHSAECLACKDGITVEAYCKKMFLSNVPGCTGVSVKEYHKQLDIFKKSFDDQHRDIEKLREQLLSQDALLDNQRSLIQGLNKKVSTMKADLSDEKTEREKSDQDEKESREQSDSHILGRVDTLENTGFDFIGEGWCRPGGCDRHHSACRIDGYFKDKSNSVECRTACLQELSCTGYAISTKQFSSAPNRCYVYGNISSTDTFSDWNIFSNSQKFLPATSSKNINVGCWRRTVVRSCSQDSDCAGPNRFCFNGWCSIAECSDSDECTDYNNPFCDSGACIQCNGRSCTAQQPYCVNDNCVECRRNDDCVDGIEAAHPYCVDDTCVECVQNSDCSSGACNTSSGRCYNYKGWVWCTGDYISSHPTLESAIEACSRNSSCGCIGDRYCDGYSYHTVVGTARYVDPKKSCSWVAP